MRGLEQRVELLHQRCGNGGRADSGEVLRPTRGTEEGDERSGVKVDSWSLLWRWRIGEGVAVLVCVFWQRRLFGLVLVNGFLGFAANGSGLGGNGRRLAGVLGEGKPRGWQEGAWACQRAATELLVAENLAANGSEEMREREWC